MSPLALENLHHELNEYDWKRGLKDEVNRTLQVDRSFAGILKSLGLPEQFSMDEMEQMLMGQDISDSEAEDIIDPDATDVQSLSHIERPKTPPQSATGNKRNATRTVLEKSDENDQNKVSAIPANSVKSKDQESTEEPNEAGKTSENNVDTRPIDFYKKTEEQIKEEKTNEQIKGDENENRKKCENSEDKTPAIGLFPPGQVWHLVDIGESKESLGGRSYAYLADHSKLAHLVLGEQALKDHLSDSYWARFRRASKYAERDSKKINNKKLELGLKGSQKPIFQDRERSHPEKYQPLTGWGGPTKQLSAPKDDN